MLEENCGSNEGLRRIFAAWLPLLEKAHPERYSAGVVDVNLYFRLLKVPNVLVRANVVDVAVEYQ